MQKLFWIYVFAAVAVLGLAACEDDPDPVVYKLPEATFSVEGDQISTKVDEEIQITAYPKPEGKVYSRWFVDDVLEASTEAFSYKFSTPGNKKITYQARNGAGEFTKDFTVSVGDILQISLSVLDSLEITRMQFDELKVMAIVEAGIDVAHEWKIDNTVVSTERYLEGFMLDELRDYKVAYKGSNSAGEYTQDFTVKMIERPLQIDFSVTASNITQLVGQTAEITATILYGGIGAQQEWKVNGNVVSTTGKLEYLCTAEGEFAIEYKCTNGIGETVTRSWTLTVSDGRFLIDDFESYALVNDVVTIGWFSGTGNQLRLIENPDKSGINPSSKSLQQYHPANAGTSGITDLKIPGEYQGEMSKYRGIRIKYYKDRKDRKIEVGKGVNETIKAVPVVADGVVLDGSAAEAFEWTVCEFLFPDGFTEGLDVIRLRILRNTGNAGASTIYAIIDDVELFM